MTSQHDIYRAASELIKRHGDEAELEAARQADSLLKRGDQEGVSRWLRTKQAVGELMAQAKRDMATPAFATVTGDEAGLWRDADGAKAAVAWSARISQMTGRVLAAASSAW